MSFATILETIDGWVWGPVMLVILVGTGIFLTLRTKFLPWRNLGYAIKSTLSKEARTTHRGTGDVSPFACLCTALAATIGTGNIAGVASPPRRRPRCPGLDVDLRRLRHLVQVHRVRSGRQVPDHQRQAGDAGRPHGVRRGGHPCRLRRQSSKGLGKVLGILFAFFAVVASFGIGNLTQGNSIADAFHSICGVPMWIVGIIVGLATLVIVVGGLKSISKVSSVVVPVMAIFYFVGALIVICCHITAVPGAFVDMFRMAFSVKAVGGGVPAAWWPPWLRP